ncbi:DNA repair protein RecO [Pseudoxanthomonas sp. NC8]|nr:DNA repair protein RecO [Pseudoxanthomonas sp. NC8]
MRIEGETGFVLHARPWRETSLLVEVLSAGQAAASAWSRGVHSPKRQVLRAALQPLQYIRFDAVLAGELAQLRAAEALDAAPVLSGDALLAAFYLNELVLRLAPRQDPLPELDAAYARTRERLRAGDALAWTLRRFERDLLDALGVGFELHSDGDGEAIDPAARYLLDPEHGPRRLLSDRGQSERSAAATGRALLALAADARPEQADLASLRMPLRAVLAHHPGPRGLKSWEMAAALGRIAPAR